MEVQVTDEMIEKILREQMRNKIDQYLQRQNNPYYFLDLFRDVAKYEVKKAITDEFIRDSCKEISKEDVSNRIADKITERIANALSDY